MSRRDLTGQRFGRLVAVEHAGYGPNSTALWRCACDCGEAWTVPANSLIHGYTRSCGCLRAERARTLHAYPRKAVA